MSGVSPSEFLLLSVIGLIVLGPKRLPEIANRIGRWVGQARRMTRVMKRQLEDELNLDQYNSINPAKITQQADAVADHIPNDDDAHSPLHEDEPNDDDAQQDKQE